MMNDETIWDARSYYMNRQANKVEEKLSNLAMQLRGISTELSILKDGLTLEEAKNREKEERILTSNEAKVFLDKYQEFTSSVAIYHQEVEEAYLFSGLMAEVGELMDIYAKELRDKPLENRTDCLQAEIGDILWFISQICNREGLSLFEVYNKNIAKLESRRDRRVLSGSGDFR